MKREEISQQYKWKMEDLYATNEAWEADFEKLQKQCNVNHLLSPFLAFVKTK